MIRKNTTIGTTSWNSGVSTSRSGSVRVVVMMLVLGRWSNTIRSTTIRITTIVMVMMLRILARLLVMLLVMVMRSALGIGSNTIGTTLRIPTGRKGLIRGGNTIGTILRIARTAVRAMRLPVMFRSNVLWGWSSSITTRMNSLTLGGNTIGTILRITRRKVFLLRSDSMRIRMFMLRAAAGRCMLWATMRLPVMFRSNVLWGWSSSITTRMSILMIRKNTIIRTTLRISAGRKGLIRGEDSLRMRMRMRMFMLRATAGRCMLWATMRLPVMFRSYIFWGWSSSITTRMSILMIRKNTIRTTLRISAGRKGFIRGEDSLRMRMRMRMRMRGTVFTILAVIALKMTRWQTILVVCLDSVIRATIRSSCLVGGEYVFRLYIV